MFTLAGCGVATQPMAAQSISSLRTGSSHRRPRNEACAWFVRERARFETATVFFVGAAEAAMLFPDESIAASTASTG
jgi:hypothetical protein